MITWKRGGEIDVISSQEGDLNIGDSYGNSLIEIGENIKTKNFDSSKTVSISLDNSDNTLNIGDSSGNVLLGIDSMGKITSKSIKLFPRIGSPINYIPNDIESGGTVFDNVESLYSAFDDLVVNNPRWIKRESDIGLDESGDYTMRHYTVCNQYASICSDRAGDNTNQWNDNLYQRRRILINLSVHSNEKYATLAGFLMIKEIIESNDDWAMFIKCNTVLDIVPCCNPYGLDNNSAYNVNGVNLNRGYDEDETAEQEVKNMKSLINNLLQKGLIGIIDFHNTGVGEAYIIARKDYTRFSWFAVLTQSIEALLGAAFSDVFSSSQHTNHMHLWTYESEANSIGQLHWYANKIGILGTTIEVSLGAGTKGSRLEKAIGINLINSYINY